MTKAPLTAGAAEGEYAADSAGQPAVAGRAPGGKVAVLIANFMVISVLAGVLMAGMLLPAVGATGTLTRDSLQLFNTLPVEFQNAPSPEGSTMYANDGKTVIATFYEENRQVVPLSKISPSMLDAVVSIEDARFYEHAGVDAKGLLRAVISKVTGGQVQGASTLTQQYVKNKILEAAVATGDKEAQEEAVVRDGQEGQARKIKEIRMAIQLEKTKSKDEILQGYLNVANFGSNNYGVQAASQYFFQTDASKLTLAQSAMLAGIVQIPEQYNPVRHPAKALKRRTMVLTRMLELGKINRAQYDIAMKEPLPTKVAPATAGCISASPNYAFFCQYAYKMLLTDPRYAVMGRTVENRVSAIRRGKYKIVTSMDAKLQNESMKILAAKIPIDDPSGVSAVSATTEPGTGRVLAVAQNSIYSNQPGKGHTEFVYGADYKHGGIGGVQIGSTFKPAVLATWLDKGKGLGTSIPANQTFWPAGSFTACGKKLTSKWEVFNAADGQGPAAVSVLEATYNSINLGYAEMLSKLDLCDVAKTAEAMGLHLGRQAGADYSCWDLPPSRDKEGNVVASVPPVAITETQLPTQCPAMILGSFEMSPITVAGAFATFAADGTRCDAAPIEALYDRSGKQVKMNPRSCTPESIKPDVARGVAFAGKRVFTDGTAKEVGGIAWPAGGKTGTTDNSVRTWFTGYTRQRSTSVFIADLNPYWKDNKDHSKGSKYPGGRSLNKRKIGDTSYGNVYGATIAAPLWKSIMNVAQEGLPKEDWADPPRKMIEGTGKRVASVTGHSIQEATQILYGQGFKVTVGKPVASSVGPSTVADQAPNAGQRMDAGSTVTIYPGDGSVVEPPAGPTPGGTPAPPVPGAGGTPGTG